MPPALHTVLDGPKVGATPRGRLVLVHGFTQTMRSWDPLVAVLSDTFEVKRVDVTGHGASSEVRLSFTETAAAIGEAGGPATYVGYSMGGRLCLQLALDRPDVVQALVLVGASPGLEDAGERAQRRTADVSRADDIERTGTADFIARWLAQPLFASFTPDPGDLRARLANSPHGLAAALRSLGTGVQEPLWSRLPTLTMPVLVVVGGADERYARIGRQMSDIIGDNAQVVSLVGAGHAAHLEEPLSFCRLLVEFGDLHPSAP